MPGLCESSDSEVEQPKVMPCKRGFRRRHRHKLTRNRLFPFNAAVARPVGKAEIAKNPKAKESMDKEWRRLRENHVWDEDHPREWDDVRREAERGGYDVHLGWLFGICVEKLRA